MTLAVVPLLMLAGVEDIRGELAARAGVQGQAAQAEGVVGGVEMAAGVDLDEVPEPLGGEGVAGRRHRAVDHDLPPP